MKIKAVLHDLVTLRLPVTAAAVTTTLIGVLAPFGVDLSKQTVVITGALSALGLIASFVEKYTK
jgi:hypothetical protein